MDILADTLDTIKYLDTIEDIASTISSGNLDINALIAKAKQEPDAKNIIPKICSARTLIVNKTNVPVQPVANVPVQNAAGAADPGVEFRASDSETIDQREDRRRKGWDSPYTLVNFESEMKKVPCFASKDEAKKYILPKLLKIARMINYKGDKYVMLKPTLQCNPVLKSYSKFKETYSKKNMCCTMLRVGTDMVPMWWYQYLDTEDILTYYHFDWIPYTPLEKEPTWGTDVFNLFNGFKAKLVQKPDFTKLQPIFKHIYEVWAGGDANKAKMYFEWIIAWIAHLIQKPRE